MGGEGRGVMVLERGGVWAPSRRFFKDRKLYSLDVTLLNHLFCLSDDFLWLNKGSILFAATVVSAPGSDDIIKVL